MAKNCNTSPFYLQGQSPTIQNQVAIIERFLKKQLPNYAVISISLNGIDIPKDELGNVNLEIERINYAAGDGIRIDDNVISCTITDTTYTAGENISIDENNVISTTVIDDSTQSNNSTWSSNKINSLIQEFNNFTITVVNQLPVSGEPYVLYLVGNESEEQSNVNDEYLWIVENNVGRWEKIGTTQITILQSDWHQSDTTAQDYIKNKPTDLVHTSDIEGLLRNDGTVYTGKYLEQVQDLDNFQASEGKIVQYIGETNSKYTNSFNYRKVGVRRVIQPGTRYIEINDATGELLKVGVPNDKYYKIDEYEEIVWHTQRLGSPKVGEIPVKTDERGFNMVTNIGSYAIVNNKFLKITSVRNLDDNGHLKYGYRYGSGLNSIIGFEDNTEIELDNLGQGNENPIIQNNLSVYENQDGIRIYQWYPGYIDLVLIVEDWGDAKRAISFSTFIISSTTEEVIIDTTEWQQCVPPEEDTSHYVTDSEIGWIEH